MEPIVWFGWFRADIVAEYGTMFWHGLQMTILVTVICILQGTLLGLVIGLARLADARHAPARQLCRYLLRWPSTVYVSFFRGTPLFVQILLIHFAVLPLFINPTDGLFIAGETADSGIQVAESLAREGFFVTLDLLGEMARLESPLQGRFEIKGQLPAVFQGVAQALRHRQSLYLETVTASPAPAKNTAATPSPAQVQTPAYT